MCRHGETVAKGTYTGTRDVSLSDEGKKQVCKLSELLSHYQIDICYSSPLKRCIQTHVVLGGDYQMIINEQLREVDFGRWEGKTFQQIYVEDRELVDDWIANDLEFTFPDGESIEHFISRLRLFHKKLISDPHQNILIISHGGVIRFLICLLLDIPLKFYHKLDIKESGLAVIHGLSDDYWLCSLNNAF